MAHQGQRTGGLGFRGPTFGTRGILQTAVSERAPGAEFIGLSKQLLSVATPIGNRLAARAGQRQGAAAAAEATVTDPETGQSFPALVTKGGIGPFSEAFNRQSEKIFAQRLETVTRQRINELTREFPKDPEGFDAAVQSFASGLKESAGLSPEFAVAFDNTVNTLAAPHANAAFKAVFDDAADDAEAARETNTLARINDARPQGRILGGGGAGSAEALDAFGKTLLQQRTDLAGDVQDGVLQPNEARQEFGEFQSKAVLELLKGMAEGSPNREALSRELSSGTLRLALPVFDEKSGKLVNREVNVDRLLLPDDQDKAITQVNTIINRAVARDEKNERDGDKATKEEQEHNAALLYDAITEGRLTDEELDQALAERRIDGDDFRTLRRALATEATSVDDPAVVVELEQSAAEGSLTLSALVDQFEAGTITQNTFQNFSGRAQGDVNETAEEALAFVRANVGGIRGPLAVLDTQSSTREAAAIREFRDQVDEGLDAWDAADDVVARYRPQEKTLKSLPRPLFLVGTPSKPDLEATKEKTATAFREGSITFDVLQREAALLEEIEEILDRQEQRRQSNEASKDRKTRQ